VEEIFNDFILAIMSQFCASQINQAAVARANDNEAPLTR
jgi:hypothetical protein